MRKTVILASLFLVPTLPAQAQDAPPGCTPLVTIQSQGCLVRQVFTCESDTQPLRWVASHGPKGPISLNVLDMNGMPQVMMTGGNNPRGTLSPDGDPVDLAKVLAGEADDYSYRLEFEDGTTLQSTGVLSLIGSVVEIDGRSLQTLQRIETVTYPNGTISPETDNRVVYDAELGLLLNTTATERATGTVLLDRTPVDFLFPGDAGAGSYAPLYGCEG